MLEHMEYYNKMAPFPPYDTEYVEEIRNKLKTMNDDKINYDDEPVVACKYCKSLHIITDEVDNNICFRCGSINDLIEFPNIFKYKDFVNGNTNTDS